MVRELGRKILFWRLNWRLLIGFGEENYGQCAGWHVHWDVIEG
ncbi:hypothetical protein [Ammoniphilus resinae]|uniref:Uncharacterized protein n=1 Tax=Ammoniphilus resinae TaxID=861532 RepID=A0ABS4GIG5_9BACL|nr:hypothetical protein [Ammoniphilus resinae]MBP1930053.1 hypothetical protein [Ammoniphilus resinae]